ncbi:MAG: EAL domain-containing protein, partial [Gammaproteobacteria bacterium]|nr:EAL domain-containing protein [Gammaproteobacteria bacterium]NIR48273.1 EAL domain-containing protein [candidate division KSB1 bacterium]NIV45134.1 EAL domain-containing protein [Candidatus Bathyarchaeota archaeon]NIS24535.1 EAL domain-containing protein [candidate division KSB1 bacterium]NIU25144.1 EAL domain-containing protein [candidate division KSB1 bacterium]
LDVIAEGVETRKQLEYLSSTYCNEIQGHYFAKPQTSEHLAKLLNSDYVKFGKMSSSSTGNSLLNG